MATRLISQNSKKDIDLGDGDIVTIRGSVSFNEMLPITSKMNAKNEVANMAMAMPLLELSIVDWNLKNEEGEPIEFTKDKIELLDFGTVTILVQKIMEVYFPEKKTLTQSEESSSTEA